MHVDDWMDSPEAQLKHPYAVFVIHHMRLPANLKATFFNWMDAYPLYCKCDGEDYQVVSASRFGCISLSSDMRASAVSGPGDVSRTPDQCSDWTSRLMAAEGGG